MNMNANILLIEDDVDFRKTLVRALEKEGYSVTGAGNGTEAIASAQKQIFDLIISDVRLSGAEDGIEIVGKIKKMPQQAEAKVLIITGYADTEAPIRAIKVGVVDYFIKPFKLEEFFTRVEECLASQRTIDALELGNESFDKSIESLKKIMEKQKVPKSYKRKKDSRFRIIITGATGLIGSNLLFEIIKQNLKDLTKVEIFILGRSFNEEDLKKRILALIDNEGREYISSLKKEQDKVISNFDSFIKCVNFDLEKDKLELSRNDFKELSRNYINIFYHVAASTDLRPGLNIEKKLKEVNINGTIQVLELISSLNLSEFCYVGTAYSCGKVSGTVMPDFINKKQIFRNPYERSKLESEIIVREYAKKSKIKFRYFRPSVTCGRLLENPIGLTNKFDVFYGWLAFFLRLKKKMLKDKKDIYKQKVILDMRICFNDNSGLNIVPADYVAKVMYSVCFQEDPNESYHVVNNQETPHDLYIPEMLKFINIKGIKFENKIPSNLNLQENFYYKTVGNVFTPYIDSDSINFDISSLKNTLKNAHLECPLIDKNNFNQLLNYGKIYDFGIAAHD